MTANTALQLWGITIASPRTIVGAAKRAEQAGMAGLVVTDSQNLAGEVYVALAAAAVATDRLRLGTGVTNPVTRHPAVTAASIAAVQQLSDGRAYLGIGRGDSALAHLGRAPASVSSLERYVVALQAYLRGEAIPFDDLDFHERLAPPVETLGLADTPGASRITWLRDIPKVPIEVVATGPKVIALAALHADRVLLAVGADPERLTWAIELARSTRRAAGLDPDAISFGAYVNVLAHRDLPTARRLAAGGLATFARFSVMHGTATGPQDDESRTVLHRLHQSYDMMHHTRADSGQAAVLPDEFIDRYGIVGPPELCVEKLQAIHALGIDKVITVGATAGVSATDIAEVGRLFAAEVVPAFAV